MEGTLTLDMVHTTLSTDKESDMREAAILKCSVQN